MKKRRIAHNNMMVDKQVPGRGQHEEGLQGLQETTRDGSNVQISGAGNDGGG